MGVIEMRKRILCAVLALSFIALAGCEGQSSGTDTSSEISTNEPAGSASDISSSDTVRDPLYDETAYGNITGAFSSLNVFINTESGDQIASGLAGTQDLSKGLSLTIYTSFEPDGSANSGGIDADVYIFCNGHVIMHSQSSDGIPAGKTSHTLSPGATSTIPVYIPPTSVGDVDEALMWICINYMPDYTPYDGMGEVEMISMWYVHVTSSGAADAPSLYEADEEDYLYGKRPMASNGEEIGAPYIDIGTYRKEYYSSTKITMDDLSQIGADTDFALTAYSDVDCDYYFAVFRNGELIDAFDGKTFMKANFLEGERMIKYSPDRSYLPQDGVYSYIAIAMPAEAVTSDPFMNAAESNRRRITIAVSANQP